MKFDTFDGAKLRTLVRSKKRRSVSTLSIPRASARGVEWVDCKDDPGTSLNEAIAGAKISHYREAFMIYPNIIFDNTDICRLDVDSFPLTMIHKVYGRLGM